MSISAAAARGERAEVFARVGREPRPFAPVVGRGEEGGGRPETPQQRLERAGTERGRPRERGPREDLIGQRHAAQYRQGAAGAPARAICGNAKIRGPARPRTLED